MKFLGELKRRNVFRIGMAYIVAAWVVIQIGDIIATNYRGAALGDGGCYHLCDCGLARRAFFHLDLCDYNRRTQERI